MNVDMDDEPISAVDLAMIRHHDFPGLSNNALQGAVKRVLINQPRRGRPPKKPRQEYVDLEETSSEEEREEDALDIEPMGNSSGDENDPDWRKGREFIDKPFKRVTKKMNYNMKTLMQMDIAPTKTGRPRGRPRGSYKNFGSPRLLQFVADDSESKNRTEMAFLLSKLPQHSVDPPPADQRLFAVTMDKLNEVKGSSGGFRAFIRALDDATVLEIYNFINERYSLPEKGNDAMQIVQCLRHMWNKIPEVTRKLWEAVARKKAKENYETGIDEEEEDDEKESPNSSNFEELMQKMSNKGAKKNTKIDKDEFCRMPLNENPFHGSIHLSNDVVIPVCCPDSEPLKNFNDVKKHFLSKHYTAHLYACQFCNILHESKEHLLKHNCKDFSEYMINRLVAGVVDDPEMRVAYLFITCHECGFWLPIREIYKADHLEKAWNFFVTINKYHCGESLNLVVIYALSPIKEEGNDYFYAKIVPKLATDLPMSCKKCKIEFTTLKEMNSHMLQHEEYKCTKCDEKFGTKAHLRLHGWKHMQNKSLFAKYLRESMTVYPPAHVKNALPRVGFQEKGSIAYGGKAFTGEENLYEFISTCEPLIDSKISNATNEIRLEKIKEHTDETEGYSLAQLRGDIGFEYERQYMKPSAEETQTIEMLNKIFSKQMTDKSRLKWNAHIHKLKDMKKGIIFVNEKEKGKVGYEIQAAEMTVMKGSNLADEVAEHFAVTVKLPVLACFDALSDGLLIHDYDICTSCSTIFSDDGGFLHSCETDQIFPIHRWKSGRRCRVSCHICKDSYCSIYSLRAHYLTEHLKVIDLHPLRQKKNLMGIAVKAMAKGARSLVARMTDASFFMDETLGVLKPKHNNNVTPVRNVAQSGPAYNSPRRGGVTYAMARGGGHMPHSSTAPKKSIVLVKPYTENPSRTEFSCAFCQKFFCQSIKKMAEHLRQSHTLLCRGCGQAFCSQRFQVIHEKVCPKTFTTTPMCNLKGTCVVCRKIDNLPNLYTHIFEAHLPVLNYSAEDGRIFKKDSCWLFVKDIHITGGITQSNQIKPAYQRVSDSKLPCYLCGFEFDTQCQLNNHLERHPEKWTHCPFCSNYHGSTHEAFRRHLQCHYEDRGTSLVCRVCSLVLPDRNMISHLLYGCFMMKKCSFCNWWKKDCTPEDKKAHNKLVHGKIFNRYACTECKLTAPHLAMIKNHTCKVYDMDHRCACGKVSSGRTAFIDHFWQHVDVTTHSCLICHQKFHGMGASITSHRLTHASVIGKANKRTIKIIDDELFTGKSYQKNECQEKPDIVEIDSDEEPSTSLNKTNSDETVVKKILEVLLKQVCIELGDDDQEGGEGDDGLTANVRTESDDVMVANSHPGYVDDEMDIADSPKRVTASVLKEITDDNDDECRVVAEVEHPSGASSSAAANTGREKKYKCTMCSQGFFTHVSLMEHEIKSHRNDAGGICEKVYGAPLDGTHYVCRNCCALFETQPAFRKHMQAHGITSGISCPSCSGISYNQPLFSSHQACHHRTGKGKLYYGCGTCSLMFASDMRLYHHIQQQHSIPLLFFCKACSLTSMQANIINDHLYRSSMCRTNLQNKEFKIEQMMGAFPANLVHFQPNLPDIWDQRIKSGAVRQVIPSECTHRSFLTLTDSVISCKECHCTMAATTFYANEEFLKGRKEQPLINGYDDLMDNPFFSRPNAISNAANRQRPSLHLSSNVSHTPGLRNALTSLSATYQRQSIINKQGNAIKYTAVSRPLPSAVNGQRYAVIQPVVTNLQPLTRSTTMGVPRTSNFPTKCEVCNGTMGNVKVRRLHDLHTNGQEWFCLNCAAGHKSEADAVRHSYNCGLTEEKRARLTKTDFRSGMLFQLNCPIEDCSHGHKEKKNYFPNIMEYKKHLAKEHKEQLPHIGTCGLRFATEEAMDKHDAEHLKVEEKLGTPGNCCVLCGIGNQWNMPAEIHSHQTIISHLAIHGLHTYTMCRGCFTCFTNDFDGSKTLKHFETSHTTTITTGMVKCSTCNTAMKQDMLKEHVMEKHTVRGYKARHNSNHQLVVKTVGQTRLFMGLPFEGFVDDDDKAV